MKNSLVLASFLSVAFILSQNTASASTGGFTLSSDSTSAQTLSGGTGTINFGVTLNVNSGGQVAVSVTGSSTLTNLGTIEELDTASADGQSGRAIRVNNGSIALTVNNGSTTNSTALIETGDADAFQENKASDSVIMNNYGTVNSLNFSLGGNQAIDWNAITSGTNTLNNFYSGVLEASEADAVRPGVNGIINNSGKIFSSTTTGSSSDGIDAQTNSGVTITNAASSTAGVGALNLIEGARHGITGGNDDPAKTDGTYTMSITNNAGGTIQGDNGSGVNIDGFNAKEVVTIVNAGTISGDGHNINDGKSHDGDGVDVDGIVNLTNSGTIVSKDAYEDTSEGVTVGGGTIVNSGTIEGSVTTAGAASGSVGRGITLAGIDKDVNDNAIPIQPVYIATSVTNNSGGLIKGDTDSGIAIEGIPQAGFTEFNVTITNNVNATIEGNGAVAVIDGSALANGVGTASGNNETVINYGTIKQDGSGKAINLGSGANSVQIIGGTASINGDISGGTSAGTNSLLIDPNAVTTVNPLTGQSFSYSHVLSNFASVEIASGTVTFSGANTYTGTTTIDGLATLDLTGSGTIGNTTTLTIGSGGVFDLGGGSVTVGTLNNSGTINNGMVHTSSSGGSVSDLSGSTGVSQSTGTTNVTGTNSYTGATTVTGGELNVSGTITSSTTTVSGTGNLHLSGGTTAAVNLGGGGSLTGNGTVGALTINSGGVLSPGNSPGVVNAGNTTFNPGGSMLVQVNTDGSTGAAGVNWDQLAITGKLDLSSLTPSLTFVIDVQSLDSSNAANPLLTFNPNIDHTWVDIITTTGGFTGTFNSDLFSINGSQFENTYSGTFSVTQDLSNPNALDLTYSTPEPSTWALILTGLGALAFVRRRLNRA